MGDGRPQGSGAYAPEPCRCVSLGNFQPPVPGSIQSALTPSARERAEVIWALIRGLHQGQRPEVATTGRTHGCTRPTVNTNSPLAPRGPSTHGPTDRVPTTFRHHTIRLFEASSWATKLGFRCPAIENPSYDGERWLSYAVPEPLRPAILAPRSYVRLDLGAVRACRTAFACPSCVWRPSTPLRRTASGGMSRGPTPPTSSPSCSAASARTSGRRS